MNVLHLFCENTQKALQLTMHQIKSNGLFQLRAKEGQTIKEEILNTMINGN